MSNPTSPSISTHQQTGELISPFEERENDNQQDEDDQHVDVVIQTQEITAELVIKTNLLPDFVERASEEQL